MIFEDKTPRELDALISRELFGNSLKYHPTYSTDYGLAFMVLNRLRDLGWHWYITNYNEHAVYVRLGRKADAYHRWIRVYKGPLPLAVAIASEQAIAVMAGAQ